MSFSRISTLALALAAGLAAPVSAATVDGIFSVNFGTSMRTDVTGLTRAPDFAVTGTGSVTLLNEFETNLFTSAPTISDDGGVEATNPLSADSFEASTTEDEGSATFEISRSFTLAQSFVDLSTGFLVFDLSYTASASSLRTGDTARLSVFAQLVELTDDGETVVLDENGEPSFSRTLFDVTDGGANGPVFESIVLSFLVNEDTTYRFDVFLSGSAETLPDNGFVDPDPNPPPVIPLPASAALLPLGLVALGALRRRRKG